MPFTNILTKTEGVFKYIINILLNISIICGKTTHIFGAPMRLLEPFFFEYLQNNPHTNKTDRKTS